MKELESDDLVYQEEHLPIIHKLMNDFGIYLNNQSLSLPHPRPGPSAEGEVNYLPSSRRAAVATASAVIPNF